MMIIAGVAEVFSAFQIKTWGKFLLWVLLGSVALSALIATTLAYRNFFTPAHQLREPPAP